MALATCQLSSIGSSNRISSNDCSYASNEVDIEVKVSNFINEFFGIEVGDRKMARPASCFKAKPDGTSFEKDKNDTETVAAIKDAGLDPRSNSECCTVPIMFGPSEAEVATPLQRLEALKVGNSHSESNEMCVERPVAEEEFRLCVDRKDNFACDKDLEAALSGDEPCRKASSFPEANTSASPTESASFHVGDARERTGSMKEVSDITSDHVSYAFIDQTNCDDNRNEKEGSFCCAKFRRVGTFPCTAGEVPKGKTRDICPNGRTGHEIKPSCKKPPRPPRPQRLHSDSFGRELTRYVSDAVFIQSLQTARLERMRFKRKKMAVSTSNATSLWALVTTLCFAVMVVIQGLMSHDSGNLKEQGSTSVVVARPTISMHGETLPYREAVSNHLAEASIYGGAEQKSEAESIGADRLQQSREARRQQLEAVFGVLNLREERVV